MGEVIKQIQIRLSFSRKQLIIGAILIVVIVVGILTYKYNWHEQIYAYAMRADATITILDSANSEKLPATVKLTNKERPKYSQFVKATDEGIATITKLVKGNYDLVVKYDGYDENSSSITLKRGKNNSVEIKLIKTPPAKVEVIGVVKNYISETPVKNAAIKIGDNSTTTDSNGNFSLPEVTTGDYEISVKESSYIDYKKSISITKETASLCAVNLVPQGKVVFVSNREGGKRGIFTTNYDSSEMKSLVARVDNQEDINPILSDDGKKVIFLSSREGKKENGNPINGLFVVDIDGKNLTKIADKSDYNIMWSKNSKYVIWNTNTRNENNNSTFDLYIYNVAKKENTKIATSGNGINSLINDSAASIVYNTNTTANGKFQINAYDIASGTSKVVAENSVNMGISKFISDKEVLYSVWQNNQTKYYAVNIDTNEVRETQYEYATRILIKSPDGKLVSYIEERDGKRNVFVANVDNSNEKQLTQIDVVTGEPYWSLNNKYIFFKVWKIGENALYVVGVDGGTAKKITDISNGEGY